MLLANRVYDGGGDFAAPTTLVWIAFAPGGEARTRARFTRAARARFAIAPIKFIPTVWSAVAKSFAKVAHFDAWTGVFVALSFAFARGILRPNRVGILSHFKPTLNRRMF